MKLNQFVFHLLWLICGPVSGQANTRYTIVCRQGGHHHMKGCYCGILAVALLILALGTAHGAGAPGDLSWSYPTGGAIAFSSPAIGGDGTIYVGSGDYKLYAINPNGSFKWSHTTDGEIWTSPAIGADGTIYVASSDPNYLYAIDPDGNRKWSYAIEGYHQYSSPAVGVDGTVYIGQRTTASVDSKIYAINPNGTFKWSYSTANRIDSSPAIGADGTVYAGSYDRKLYAINPDGSKKWSYLAGGEIHSSPAIGADGTIYMGALDHKLYAVNPNGTFKWYRVLSGQVSSSPAIGADGTIYVGTGEHSATPVDARLYAVNPDGTVKWSYAVGDTINSSPAIGADGTIYVGSYDFKLYAVNPNGTLAWSYTTGDAIGSSPAIGSDGTIYVGSSDSNLYAIYSSSLGLADSPWPMFRHDLKRTGFSTIVVPTGFTLTATKLGAGSGTVTSSPAGIDCGSTCSASFEKRTKVTLTPTPDSGSVFVEWTGACKGSGACSVTMTGDITVGATFILGSCDYKLSPSTKTVSYKGGTVAIGITASLYSYCPAPEIVNTTDFTYTVGAFTKNKGSIKVYIPLLDSSIDKTGTFAIGEYTSTVTQKGKPCAYTLSSSSSDLLLGVGDTGTFTVTATPTDCAWTTSLDAKSALWITIDSGGAGKGDGPIDYTVSTNSTGKARSGKITVTVSKKNKSYTVKQSK